MILIYRKAFYATLIYAQLKIFRTIGNLDEIMQV